MNFLETINTYWPIIVFIVGVISSWVYFKYELDDIAKRVQTLEDSDDKRDQDIASLKEIAVEIKTTLKFILQKLDQK